MILLYELPVAKSECEKITKHYASIGYNVEFANIIGDENLPEKSSEWEKKSLPNKDGQHRKNEGIADIEKWS